MCRKPHLRCIKNRYAGCVAIHTKREPRNVVGPNVIKYRRLRGWTQAEFVARCQAAGWEISRDVLTTIENRTRWVGDFEIIRLARVLSVPVTDMLPDKVHWDELPSARRKRSV